MNTGITCSEAGKRGGKSRSEKKLAAVRENAAKARAKLAEIRAAKTRNPQLPLQ